MRKSFHKIFSARETAPQDIFHSDQHELVSDFYQSHTVNPTIFIEVL